MAPRPDRPQPPATPRWLTLLWDWGPAGVALAAGALGGVTGHEEALWLALGAASALAIGLRSRGPVVAWAASLVLVAAAAVAEFDSIAVALLVPVLPLAAVAADRPPVQSLPAALATFAGLCAAAVTGLSLDALDGVMVAVLCLALAATGWLIGYAIHSRRRYAEALEERARWDVARAALVERQALARELHDVVSHNVSVMTLQASAAAAVWDDDPEMARNALRAVEDVGRSAMSELRAMLDAMRGGPDSPGADRPAAQPRLRDVHALTAGLRAAGLEVAVDVRGPVADLPAAVDLSAYRIVQEALTNVLRHAAARRVDVVIACGHDTLDLQVRDDGQGFDAEATPVAVGHGISGMRERAALLGGAVEVVPAERGTVVRATIPCDGEDLV